jgi:ABC-2 type transport system permease protein
MFAEHLSKWAKYSTDSGNGSNNHSSNSTTVITRTLSKMMVIWELELRKTRRDYTDLLIRAIQPVLWLIVFGSAFSYISHTSTLPISNSSSYLAYLTPGILAQSVLFISIFTGISMIWERDLGQLDRLLCSPIPRAAIVLGKSFTGGVRGLVQAFIIFVIAIIMGVSINFNPLHLAAVAAIVFTFGIGFSSLSISISTLIKSRERIFGLVQLLTMPLFFASNALYPIDLMPKWLQLISYVNPVSYAVDALRIVMITGNFARLPIDLGGIGISTTVFVLLATIAFRKIQR